MTWNYSLHKHVDKSCVAQQTERIITHCDSFTKNDEDSWDHGHVVISTVSIPMCMGFPNTDLEFNSGGG